MKTVEITDYRACEQALKEPGLKQSLYDEGAILMDRVLVTLHGEEHRERRLLEMRVFRRDFFRRFEQEVIPQIYAEVMAVTDTESRVDLVELGYNFMVYLAVAFAGIDRRDGTAEELNTLIGMLRMFGVAATLGQAIDKDREAAKAEVKETLAEFDRRFFTPSAERRQALLAQVANGELTEDELPMDVLTVLLRNENDIPLVRDMMLRETAFYFLASAHTSVHSLSHAVHHLLQWVETHGDAGPALLNDRILVQRFVHESFRLHPSSPVAARKALEDVEFTDGQHAAEGDRVLVSLRQANRDESIFGANADEFDPFRTVTRGVAETGITFGIGMHSCLGKNLAAGTLPVPGRAIDPATHQLGTITWIAHRLLQEGVHADPDRPAQLDESIERETWQSYPVRFSS